MKLNSIKFQDYKPEASRTDKYASIIVFFMWPLLGTILSFRHYKFKNSKNIIWFFCIFLGLSFAFSEGSDSSRYRNNLKYLYQKQDYSFTEFLEYVFGEESNTIDFVQPIINFIISRFTDNGFILYGVYGLVFGYFYSRNVWYLINKVRNKVKIEALAFLVLFAILVPPWSINGFRYWTATHVFFYGLIQYFEGNKKGLIVIVCSVFVHYTYILGVFLFAIFFVLGNRLNLYFLVYILSLFLSFVDISAVKSFTEKYSSEKVQNRAGSYLTEEYSEVYFGQEETVNWYMKYRYDFIKILVAGSYFWIFFARQKLIRQNLMMLKLFCIGLIFMSFANINQSIPGMVRFFYIGFMSVTVMLFLFFQLLKFKRRPDWYKFVSILFVFLFCMVEIRIGFDSLSVATMFGNPFTVGWFDKSVSLFQFLFR